MKICVVGAGYVGLVTGTCLAESGNDVCMVEVDEGRVKLLREGRSPIYEPGLEELLKRNIAEKRLRFTTDLAEGVRSSKVIFIAVGTPATEAGPADLRAFYEVVEGIGRAMDGYRVVVAKSTVPVGTAGEVKRRLGAVTRQEFDVVSNPEFLKEGAAVGDFMRPDRVIIGAQSERAIEVMRELYGPFVRTESPVIVMDTSSAEMTKLAANAMLAARISFMNELANLCEGWGADVDQVRRGLGTDNRIGRSFLFPGVGFGGSCFSKDLSALEAMGRERGIPTEVISAVQTVNQRQRRVLVEKVLKHFGGSLKGLTVAVWGLAFKPSTDDMRDAPAVTVIEGLLAAGAKVRAHDPVANERAREIFGERVELCALNYDCLKGADALVVVTEWKEFGQPDLEKMRSLMKQAVVFDGRNIYDPAKMARQGFTYYSMGRPSGVRR